MDEPTVAGVLARVERIRQLATDGDGPRAHYQEDASFCLGSTCLRRWRSGRGGNGTYRPARPGDWVRPLVRVAPSLRRRTARMRWGSPCAAPCGAVG